MGAVREDLVDPARVKITLPCQCYLEMPKLTRESKTLDVVAVGAPACTTHEIPNWEDLVTQFIPEG